MFILKALTQHAFMNMFINPHMEIAALKSIKDDVT